jgi:YegS/Rv2252/BmrU family lipid kinase
MKDHKICFIANPVSGIKKTIRLEEMIKLNLDLDKFDYQVKESRNQKETIRLASLASQEGCDIVAAVGGDGTINEVIQGISQSKAILGIIPAGSGNGLARHLEIPLETDKAIKRINKMNVINIDTATINGYPFASIVGLGFDARVANKYNKLRTRGFYGYLKVVVTEFIKYRERQFSISFDGKKIECKAFLLCIANSNQFGYNTIIAPKAKADDGLLDIVIVKKFPLGEIPRMLSLLFTGKIDQSSYVEYYTAGEIFIVRKRGKRVNVDGESLRMGREISIRIQPSSVKVII